MELKQFGIFQTAVKISVAVRSFVKICDIHMCRRASVSGQFAENIHCEFQAGVGKYRGILNERVMQHIYVIHCKQF